MPCLLCAEAGATPPPVEAAAAAPAPRPAREVAAPWQEVEGGWRAWASLPSAPYPHGAAPYKDDRVWIFVPAGWRDEGPLHAVVHIHGYHTRVEALVPWQRLEQQMVASGRNAILVVPQGPRDAADMALGKLEKPEGLRRLLEDVAALMQRGGLAKAPALGSVVLSAHSGGYRGVANMLRAPGVQVQAVHLFDALYSHAPAFAAFAREGGVLRSSWTRGKTQRQNAALLSLLQDVEVGDSFDAASLQRHRVTLGKISLAHANCVHEDQAFARWLAASGLPALR